MLMNTDLNSADNKTLMFSIWCITAYDLLLLYQLFLLSIISIYTIRCWKKIILKEGQVSRPVPINYTQRATYQLHEMVHP